MIAFAFFWFGYLIYVIYLWYLSSKMKKRDFFDVIYVFGHLGSFYLALKLADREPISLIEFLSGESIYIALPIIVTIICTVIVVRNTN